MQTIILRVNVLTDDTLYLSDANKVFKGGFIAMIEYYTFLNSWNDKKHVIKFRSLQRLKNYLNKNYKEIDIEL